MSSERQIRFRLHRFPRRIQSLQASFPHIFADSRGCPQKCAENSLEGFEYALENGADGIEFDVHLTKDPVPVVMHDEKINRTTDGKGNIKDYTHEELQQFHLENGETIPDLKDVFELIEKHDALANLEFKTDKYEYRGIEEIVLNMAREYEFKHPLIYSSFNLPTYAADALRLIKILIATGLWTKKFPRPGKSRFGQRTFRHPSQ